LTDTLMDLDTLLVAGTDDELRGAISKIEETLKQRDDERKATALANAKALLRDAGIKNLGIRRKGKREGK
jgi:hypothetical protein